MSLPPRTRIGLAVGALAAVQLALLFAWQAAQERSDGRAVFSAEPVPTANAPLLIVDRRGTREPLVFPSAPTLVHFWATWCKPCREELPALLALAAEDGLGVNVVAVSVDETWEVIDHFFDGRAPPSVTRASHDDVRAAFGVEVLPWSFLVDATGVVRFRLPGAQPWMSADAREWLAAQRATSPQP